MRFAQLSSYRQSGKTDRPARVEITLHTMISLRIVRDRSAPEKDDIVRIQKQNEHTCVVSYDVANSIHRFRFAAHLRDVSHYLYSMFDLMAMDDDPFQSVQFDAPGFPSVIFQLPLSKENVRTMVSVVKDVIYSYDQV